MCGSRSQAVCRGGRGMATPDGPVSQSPWVGANPFRAPWSATEGTSQGNPAFEPVQRTKLFVALIFIPGE